jgi:hypothetical protein
VNRNLSIAAKTGPSSFEEGSQVILSLVKWLYNLLKRFLQYILNFVFGLPEHQIVGFYEFNKQENIISMIIGPLACLSVPITRYEWFGDGHPKMDEMDEMEKGGFNYWVIYYLLNSLFVLLTTNYALKLMKYKL